MDLSTQFSRLQQKSFDSFPFKIMMQYVSDGVQMPYNIWGKNVLEAEEKGRALSTFTLSSHPVFVIFVFLLQDMHINAYTLL